MNANRFWRLGLLLLAVGLTFATTRGPRSVSIVRAAGADSQHSLTPATRPFSFLETETAVGLKATPQAQGHCVVPPSGLISWWPGDGNANDIQDGNTGTLFNTTFVQ